MTRSAADARHRVALLGIPCDDNSSLHRGAAEAPAAIRRVLATGATNAFSESGLEVLHTSWLEDVGDVDLAGASGHARLDRICQRARAVLDDGARLLSIGGDHTVTWPLVRAHSEHHRSLTILHVDAHPDLYDEFEGSRLSHACPFARIMEEKLVERLIQVGIRTQNPHQEQQAQRFGVETITMRDWRGHLPMELRGPIYVSIDLDGLDPAFAPGVSHHEPGGLTSRELLALLQDIPAGTLIGADIVEFNPRRDVHGMTAALCVKLIKELGEALGG